MAGRPLVFAHRGSSEALPEHTLAAYLRALDEGSDGLECDVRLTRDGHLVCVHDRRLDRTSNGRGRVSRYTLAELDALDFGSWHAEMAAAAATALDESPEDGDRTRLLTFARLLDAVRAADRPVRLLVETKHPSRYGPEVERRLVKQLARYGLADPVAGDPVRVTVMSFSALALRRVRHLAPRLPTVYLMEIAPPGVGRGRLPFGAQIAGPGVGLARSRPGLIPAMHAAGHQVYVWTVNEAEDVDLLAAQDVDGLITDRPGFVLGRLG
ncbi:glycerophosphodiester phosphodiesterase [Spirilliplanes yamanashiensis]|uniref:Glycerophosphoryl diester phosphodiesterase n=1 Tax=Spirilliplanes yamanashiensis TaxID=42233 RepID=A0A8J3Y744_9ACTN|nr:glycerophosphodiester phosphodiesterase [Spirilliplanes yamanashiensis]MDP9814859.1 glycerophosphoryl diester phosphodiesterase [Spirilliplanes yamanashiensis]GIJ02513.1 glycerophosphoryl diester phosphodiesterase [Spirilliplanes yamanashiensis]